jgi:hypothetical protein
MPATRYLAKNMLELVLGIGSFPSPNPLYLAFGKTVPDPDGNWHELPVQSGSPAQDTGYRRQAIGFQQLPDSSDYLVGNCGLDFDTAQTDWGLLSAYAFFDAKTGGNMLLYGEIAGDPEIIVLAGQWLTVLPGSFQYIQYVTLDAPNPASAIQQKMSGHIFLGQTFSPGSIFTFKILFPANPPSGYQDGTCSWGGVVDDGVSKFTARNTKDIQFGTVAGWPTPINLGQVIGSVILQGMATTSFSIVNPGDTPTIFSPNAAIDSFYG